VANSRIGIMCKCVVSILLSTLNARPERNRCQCLCNVLTGREGHSYSRRSVARRLAEISPFCNQRDAHTPFIAMELTIHTILSIATACWQQSESRSTVVFQMRLYLDEALGLVGLGLWCISLVPNGLIHVLRGSRAL
jgi:hypothetical protein